MLGPSIILVGLPAALGSSLYALARAPDRPFAVAALVLSAFEAVALLSMITMCFAA